MTKVRHVTLNDMVHVLRILFDMIHHLFGLGFEERRIEFCDGDLIQMALHALVLFLTTPRQVGEWSRAIEARRVCLHEPHDLDVFRTGGSHDEQAEGERGDRESAYVHSALLSYSRWLFVAYFPLT